MPAAVAVVHAATGRLRIRVTGRSDEVRDVLESVERATATSPLIVYTNLRTRSPLVAWDASEVQPEQALELLRGAHAALRELSLPDHRHADGHSRVTDVIEQRLGTANRRVHRATDGSVDLRMLVPLSLAALAVRQLFRAGPRLANAPWYVLAYYAFDVFHKLHHTPPGDLQPLEEELRLADDPLTLGGAHVVPRSPTGCGCASSPPPDRPYHSCTTPTWAPPRRILNRTFAPSWPWLRHAGGGELGRCTAPVVPRVLPPPARWRRPGAAASQPRTALTAPCFRRSAPRRPRPPAAVARADSPPAPAPSAARSCPGATPTMRPPRSARTSPRCRCRQC